MRLVDVLQKEIKINDEFVVQIESLYDESLPKDVRNAVSLSNEAIFYDDFSLLRGLSHEEILDANSDLQVDFIEKKLLPLFDIGDNDFIVYDLSDRHWYKFNIVDEEKFEKTENLIQYFK